MLKRQKSVKHLSAEELKSKIYAHFDKSGSLNQLRTQLRGQLVSELFKLAPPQSNIDKISDSSTNLNKTVLPLQVCNWLIYEHLQKQGCQYSLSTFVSETNSPNLDKFLTAGDIIALFGLDSSTQEFKNISELYSNNVKGHSHSLLLAIVKCLLNTSNKEDRSHEIKLYDHNKETEPKLNLTQELANKSLNENIENEPASGKAEVELHGANLHASFGSTFNEQLLHVKEEKEKEIQKLRHKLLDELERLHSQERSLHWEIEQERREIQRERDILFSEKEKLKEDEQLFKKEQENIYEKRLREVEELHTAKLYSKEKDLEAAMKKVQDREKKLGQMEFELSTHKERFDALKRESDDINHMYKVLHEKYNNLLDENTNLVKKFENMSDYNIMKEELIKKSNEIVSLQQEIDKIRRTAENDKKNYKEIVTNLELKLKASESKLQQVQRELNMTRDTLHMEESVWNKERSKFEQESVTAKELYRTVLQRIEEQKQDIQDLHQTIHVLHYQLTNKDISNSKTDLYEPMKTINKIPYLKSDNSRTSNFSKNNPINLSHQYRKDALSLTAECKNRLNKLQQEIEAGFDKYSLIYCSSLNSNFSSTKFIQPSTLLNSTKSSILSSSKYYPSFPNKDNISQNYHLGNLTGTLPSMDLTFKSRAIETPFGMSKTTFKQTGENVDMKDLLDRKLATENRTESLTFNDNNHISLEVDSELFLMDTSSKQKSNIFAKSHDERSYMTSGIKNVTLSERMPDKATENFSSEIHKPIVSSITSVRNKDNLFKDSTIPNTKPQSLTDVYSTVLLKTSLSETNKVETLSIHSDENYSESCKKIDNFRNDIFPSKIFTSDERNLSNSLESEIEIKSSLSAQKVQNFTEVPETEQLLLHKPNMDESSTLDESLVVDLDAAWKRKSSLSTNSVPPPLDANSLKTYSENLGTEDQNKDFLSSKLTSGNEVKPKQTNLETLIPDVKGRNASAILKNNSNLFLEQKVPEILDKVEITFDGNQAQNNTENNQADNLNKLFRDVSHSTQYDESGELQECKEQTGNISVDKLTQNNEDSLKTIPSSDTSQTMQYDKNVSNSKEHSDLKENDAKSTIVRNTSSSDEEVKKDILETNFNQSYQRHDDSLSELSEIHMSCGSEQEEKKEESDNW